MFERYPVMEEAGAEGATGNPTPEVADAPTEAASSDWRSSLPPDLRDNPSLQDVTDVAGLAKRFIDTKAMVGSSVRIPTDDAGQDAINEFNEKLLNNPQLGLMKRPDPENAEAIAEIYKSLGRPEDTSGYVAPEGTDAEAFGALAEKALELGLTKNQFEQMASAQAGLQAEMMKQMENQRLDSVHQVKGEWGMAFDEKVGRAAQIAQATGAPQELVDAVSSGKVNGATLRWLDTLATQLGSEGAPMANQIGQVTTQTPDELLQRREELTARLIKEDSILTPRQKQDLQNKIVGLSEKIIASR